MLFLPIRHLLCLIFMSTLISLSNYSKVEARDVNVVKQLHLVTYNLLPFDIHQTFLNKLDRQILKRIGFRDSEIKPCLRGLHIVFQSPSYVLVTPYKTTYKHIIIIS